MCRNPKLIQRPNEGKCRFHMYFVSKHVYSSYLTTAQTSSRVTSRTHSEQPENLFTPKLR